MLTKRKRQRKSTQIPLHNLTEQKIKKKKWGKKSVFGKERIEKNTKKKCPR